MLKKKLGINAIEKNWPDDDNNLKDCFKIPSKLSIPDGCKWIGYAAFWGCVKIKEIVIPKSIERIGTGAFGYCKNAIIILKRRDYGDLGTWTFFDCKSVKYVKEEAGN